MPKTDPRLFNGDTYGDDVVFSLFDGDYHLGLGRWSILCSGSASEDWYTLPTADPCRLGRPLLEQERISISLRAATAARFVS